VTKRKATDAKNLEKRIEIVNVNLASPSEEVPVKQEHSSLRNSKESFISK
jgi:hypothetical protein